MCAFKDEKFSKFVQTPTSHDLVGIFCSVSIPLVATYGTFYVASLNTRASSQHSPWYFQGSYYTVDYLVVNFNVHCIQVRTNNGEELVTEVQKYFKFRNHVTMLIIAC